MNENDHIAGANLRDDGADAAMDKAIREGWALYVARVRDNLLGIISLGGAATLDAARAGLDAPPGFPKNANGAITLALARRAVIAPVGYVRSNVTSRHSAVVVQWGRGPKWSER